MDYLKRVTLSWAVALCTAPALAGPLANDTHSLGGIWHGSTLPYQGYYDYPGTTQPSGLQGHVDWAVYAPGTFPVGFTPSFSVQPADYVYAYQIYETGPLSLSIIGVPLFGAELVDSIGEFTGDGGFGPVTGAPTAVIQFTSNEAQWFFDEGQVVISGTNPGGTSVGLLFTSRSSLSIPTLVDGVVLDGQSTANAIPLPTPLVPQDTPEPGTIVLASFGLVALGLHWLRRCPLRAAV